MKSQILAIIILLFFSSCSTILKSIIGIKNPKIISKNEVIKYKESTFIYDKDSQINVLDLMHIKFYYTMDIAKVVI